MELRQLTIDDTDELAAFLAARARSATFLREAMGLEDDRLDATGDGRGIWAGAFDGGLRAVALHKGLGILNVEGDVAGAAARCAVGISGRPVLGVLGPYDATEEVIDALSLDRETLRFDSHEALYELELAELVLPPAMADGRRVGRAPRPEELPTLYRWRAEYEAELSLQVVTEALFEAARAKVDRFVRIGRIFVIAEDDTPRAMATWNSTIADRVQIGGVYTPPASRGRGYGRGVVAGALLAARRAGRPWGSLFTAEENTAARKAYEAIGFEQHGWYGIRLLREPLPVYGPLQ